MKKKISVFLSFIMLISLLPCMEASAVAIGNPQHLTMDFESEWSADSVGATLTGATATRITENTCGGSLGSLNVNVTANYGNVSFPLRAEAGNTYDVSLWVRPHGTPSKNQVSFVLNQTLADGGGSTYKQIFVTPAETMKANEWTYIKASFVGGTNQNGASVLPDCSIYFRIGSGLISANSTNPAAYTEEGAFSYDIDDFLITPHVTNGMGGYSLLDGGEFESEEDLDHWAITCGKTGHSYFCNHLKDGGYNGSDNAFYIATKNTYDGITTGNYTEIQEGKTYRFSFAMKADNTDAVGKKPHVWITSDASGETAKLIPVDGFNALTTEWQTYSYDFTTSFLHSSQSYNLKFIFRVGSNPELTAGARPAYYLDNVDFAVLGDADFDIDAAVYGTLENDVSCQLKWLTSTKGSFVYRFVRETADGEYCIKSGNTTDEVVNLPYNSALSGADVRLDVLGIDSYGYYSQLCSVDIPATSEYDDAISLRNNNYIWTEDTTELSATVKYQNETNGKTIKAIAALYNADGKMITSNVESKLIDKNQDKEWSVKINVPTTEDSEAVTAKFFAWLDTSSAPVTCSTSIEKTKDGDFIYVDVNSKATTESGTFDAPYKSLATAQAKWRTLLKNSTKGNIYVILKSGEYVDSSYKPLEFTKDDRVDGKQLVFTSFAGEKAKISGAMHISGAEFDEYTDGIYRVSVPDGTDTRQLYVNGIKATRARTKEDPEGFVNLDIGTTEATFENKGITCTNTSYADFAYPDELELVFQEKWRHLYIRPDAVSHGAGDYAGLSHFTFDDEVDSEGNVIGNMRAWRQITAIINTKATVPVYVENALELLDEEGEWYLDTHEDYLYYKPRSFENIAAADFVVPRTEQLVTISGIAYASGNVTTAGNISFNDIDFEYAAWNEPTTERRFICGQGATYNLDDTFNYNTGVKFPDGAVNISYAHNVNFDNCDFSHLGATALYMDGAQNCNITGNEFYEISGSAIVLGIVSGSTAVWNDYANKPQKQTKGIAIENNYIHKVATDYNSAAAVNLGLIKDTTVRNNEITDAAYDGIHAGWGWDLGSGFDSSGNFIESDFVSTGVENVEIRNNYIHNVMNDRVFDGGAIYLLGTTSGECAIAGNHIQDSLATAYIYPDQGSCNWTIANNVIDARRYPWTYTDKEKTLSSPYWLHIWKNTIRANIVSGNYSTVGNYRNDGTDISFEQAEIYPNGNWPDVAQEIIKNAGIEYEYRNRFDFDTQMLTIPKRMDISVGETQELLYEAFTSNDTLINPADLEVTVVSDNATVAKVTDNKITGVASGKTWVTVKMAERENGEIVHYDEYTFCVVVS